MSAYQAPPTQTPSSTSTYTRRSSSGIPVVVQTKDRWKIACINWGHPDAPHAASYLWDGEEMYAEQYHRSWDEAVARVFDALDPQHLEHEVMYLGSMGGVTICVPCTDARGRAVALGTRIYTVNR